MPTEAVVHAEPLSTGERADPASRQCGRCRSIFAGDPSLWAPGPPAWWLCPPCRMILVGRPED